MSGIVNGSGAPLVSPSFSGVPTAPTAPLATNTTQIATTAFVLANAGSGPVIKTARVDMGTIASATPSAVTTVLWPVAFADNNYTITGSVVILETPPNGAATEIITVSSIELTAAGIGFSFVVCNASSGVHHVIANFIAVHD